MLFDYLSLIVKDIRMRKFSSFLTFFAIGLGILSIFVIILVSSAFSNSIQEQFDKMGTNRIIITSKGSNFIGQGGELTDNILSNVESKAFIKRVTPFYIKNAQIKYQNEIKGRMILGTEFSQDTFEDFNLEVEFGRYPKLSDKYGVIIGPKFASDVFKKDVAVGSNIYIKDTKFKVVGILKSVGNPEDDKSAYFNINSVRRLYDEDDKVDMIYASVVESYDVDLAAKNVKVLLENRLGSDTVNVQTFAQMLEQITDILGVVKLVFGGVAFISLIVGALGIINTMYVVITEKTKDIGIMKAIGAKNSDIFLLYTFQSGCFGLFGAIFGVVFGSIGAFVFGFWAVENGFDMNISVEFLPVFGLLLFGFCVGVFSGFLPAYKASKLKIVETFRK
jgi:putative ABC transport system permease protein